MAANHRRVTLCGLVMLALVAATVRATPGDTIPSAFSKGQEMLKKAAEGRANSAVPDPVPSEAKRGTPTPDQQAVASGEIAKDMSALTAALKKKGLAMPGVTAPDADNGDGAALTEAPSSNTAQGGDKSNDLYWTEVLELIDKIEALLKEQQQQDMERLTSRLETGSDQRKAIQRALEVLNSFFSGESPEVKESQEADADKVAAVGDDVEDAVDTVVMCTGIVN